MAEFSGRLSKAPLVYALCQVRFSPILKMAEMVPDIQETLRDRYDEFDEERLAGIQVSAKAQAVIQGETRWRFESAGRRSGYILQNSSFVFHTTAYVDFDEFVPEVVRGFKLVAGIAKIQRLHRVGLRYIDLIEGDEKNPAESYLHPQLRGFGAELKGVTENISQYVITGSTAIGQLVLRTTRGRHEVALPPDLLPLALKVARKPKIGQISFFLDTDHFVERSETPIASEELETVLRDLKAPISSAFKKAITDKAVAAWS